MSWFSRKSVRTLKMSISESAFLSFPKILACERYYSTVQPFTGGLWECKNCTEQQLQQICKSLYLRDYFILPTSVLLQRQYSGL